MALTGGEHWARGFVWADTLETQLAATASTVGATQYNGFLRDPDGRMVVSAGPVSVSPPLGPRGFQRDANGALVVVGNQSTPRLFTFQATTPTLIDDFNRADAALHAGAGAAIWADLKVGGGASQATVATNRLAGIGNCYTLADYGPFTDIQIEVPVLFTAASYLSLYARLKDVGTAGFDGYMLLILEPSTWQIRRYTDGALAATPAAGAQALAAGDRVRFIANGDTLTGQYQASGGGAWATVCTGSDSAYPAAGRIGFEKGDTTSRMDNLAYGGFT